MTVNLLQSRLHRWGMFVGFAIAVLCVMTSLAMPQAASAAEEVPVCNPTATNGCVNGILQDSSKKPIVGATITLSGAESSTTTTDETGKWAFSVKADGNYQVAIDESVAKEHGLASSTDTVEIKKSDFSKQRGVVRFDQPSAGGASSSGSSSSSSGSSSSSSKPAPSAEEGDQFTFLDRVWQQLYSGIVFGLMLGLMSVGMNLVYGTTGLSSFSHGEQVSLGGLMAYVGTQMLHMPIWASAIFAVLVGALTGLIQNEVIWAPLRRRHVGTTQQLIVTIGLSMVLQYTFQFFFGGNIKGITTSVERGFNIGPITTDTSTLISAGIAIVVIIGLSLFLYRTRFGRATRAVSDNPALAASSGINVEQVVRVVWVLSCALAALSGVLIGIYLNGISWNTGAVLLLLMFSAVTLGGLGTANGALVGSIIIGVVADMSSIIIPNDMRYASALAILIIVLLVRPQGIFGKLQRVG